MRAFRSPGLNKFSHPSFFITERSNDLIDIPPRHLRTGNLFKDELFHVFRRSCWISHLGLSGTNNRSSRSPDAGTISIPNMAPPDLPYKNLVEKS